MPKVFRVMKADEANPESPKVGMGHVVLGFDLRTWSELRRIR
jgi:hypothetical protein